MNNHENQIEAVDNLLSVDEMVRKPDPDEVKLARNIATSLIALGGPDLSYMSDAELVKHIKQVGTRLAVTCSKLGLSAAEATESFRRCAKALNKSMTTMNCRL